MVFSPSSATVMTATPDETPGVTPTCFDGDSLRGEIGAHILAEHVGAHPADHAHGAAQAGRHDGLVGALAAVAGGEAGAVDGFAAPGKAVHIGVHVEIDGPYDADR